MAERVDSFGFSTE